MFFSCALNCGFTDVASGIILIIMFAELLFRESDLQNEKIVKGFENNQIEEKQPSHLCCSACGHIITNKVYAIDIDQHHIHTFNNPANIQYTIRCFSQAQGCLEVGHPAIEHTWFTGYKWQVACCLNCQVHLGWLFRATDKFYGLIKERLIDTSEL